MNKPMLAEKLSDANQITMSSIEIVDFINTHRKASGDSTVLRHDHFMAKVPQVLGQMHAPKFLGTQNYGNNNTRYIYNFPKREACLMAMSYSYELQALVFDRMTAMEEALKKPQPIFDITNPVHLLQAVETQARLNIELKEQVAVLEPKALALDTIADTSNTYTIRECAKTIGIREKDLINLLIEKNWCYREPSGRLQPYATKTEQKVFINRPSPIITNPNTGEEKVHLHMRVTAHGLTRITALVNQRKGG